MMRLLVTLVVLAAAVSLARFSFEDTDYVVIGYGQWVLQSSLTVFIATLTVLFVPAYLAVRAAAMLWHSPRMLRSWHRGRRYRDAQAMLSQGLTALAEGRWRAAEQLSTRAVARGANALLGYIAAARAAQALSQHARRDEYLYKASHGEPTSSVAVGIAQAELQLGEAQKEQALATLVQLRAQVPSHAYVLSLLARLYEDLGDWKRLIDLIPALKQHKVVDAATADALEALALSALLGRAAAGDDAALKLQWEAVPRAKRTVPRILGTYAELLLARGRDAELEPLLRAALDSRWDDKLGELYGRVKSPDAARQLQSAEAWLEARHGNAVLLLGLGRICIANRLWGKARSYLEASLGRSPSVEAYGVLADLLDELGEAEAAGSFARQGLAFARESAQRSTGAEAAPALPVPPAAPHSRALTRATDDVAALALARGERQGSA